MSLFFAALLFACLVSEIALRILVAPPIRWKYPQETYVYDHEVNYLLEPNQTAYTQDKEVRINSNGCRGDEYPAEPAPGVERILAMGDSQTFGNGLDLAETWPGSLEATLNERGGDVRFEVINAGVPATDTWQHRILLERLLPLYHPSRVILAFYVNDPVVAYTLPPAGSRAVTNSVSKRLVYLLKRSALLSYLHYAAKTLRSSFRPSPGALLERHRLTGEKDARVEKGWREAEEALAAMKADCDAAGIDFLVALLPRRDQVDGTLPATAYNEKVASICERQHIPLVDMLPALTEAYRTEGKKLFIPWDGHNSAAANRVIADRLAAGILSSRPPTTPPSEGESPPAPR